MRHGVVIGAASIIDSTADAIRQNQQHDAVDSTCSRTVDTNIGCLLGRLSMIGVDRVAGRFRISKNNSARNARNRTRTATPRRIDSDHAKCTLRFCENPLVLVFMFNSMQITHRYTLHCLHTTLALLADSDAPAGCLNIGTVLWGRFAMMHLHSTLS